ncbi:MAG: ribonuclease HI family protein [Bacillota bacterium]|uniref:Ribonuclease HI family protein n=1 Tax=Virgibacillus salarius TaxID=447199 RepID=A0A941DZ06_9BACI|nr:MULTISPECIES: ribonuclease HI family protein [Bacillaceae]NAZ08665.1 reverse transcriptase-like protein [Agaribacter marinus]MBR7795953.1 ribonuclease HI family protein [Virgibacillus salarius]MCC2248732.1 ribonuclease HI family protein [Virgibacillus sp. AGTR]QRZ17976.1 ribonuclease HI family protein [Virgibacillus sp. AGTR]WBX78704.1 ribonuclease HI family protein [Virgibacillus salarius]
MIEVYTDGAANGDPGPSGAGIFIKKGKNNYHYAYPLGILSNHEAEFFAVIQALELCRKEFPEEILSFRSDSKLVVDVIEKGFTKNQKFLPLLQKIQEEAAHFSFFFIKWIPEKQNFHADKLSKKAIHLNKS